MAKNIQTEDLSLPAQARDRIISLLEDRALSPGDAVSHRMLAEELGMSTLSIGSACRSLELEGLIVTRPRSGSSIAVITPADIWNMVQYRLALELHVARLACSLATDEDLERLKKLAPPVDDEKLPLRKRVAADDCFHQALRECSHTPGLYFPADYLRIFRLKLHMCAGLQLYPEFTAASTTAHNHKLLADITATRDVEKLTSLLEIHICGPVGLPQLNEIRRSAGKRLKKIANFITR